ncbi:hypothetical protein MMC11_007137 [Xylographa trunciseda]|nr:hypothetical protein [Xylographa trunciseda]
MAESTIIKLHHDFKAQDDTRTPTHFGAVKSSSDEDFEKKPTMAVSRGTELVYEYKDGASMVELAVPLEGYNDETLNQRYKTAKQEWSEFSPALLRKETFKAALELMNKVKIDQVICTGIGTFSGFHEQNADCNSYYQLADLEMFMELLDLNDKVNVFMQDPSFNELDETFLRSRGFKIIKHPEAFNKMTATTFLYAPGNHDDVAYHALRVAEPALFIGNDLSDWGKYNGLPNPDNKGQYFDKSIQDDEFVIEHFLSKRGKFSLPVPKPSTATRSYWSLAYAAYYEK